MSSFPRNRLKADDEDFRKVEDARDGEQEREQKREREATPVGGPKNKRVFRLSGLADRDGAATEHQGDEDKENLTEAQKQRNDEVARANAARFTRAAFQQGIAEELAALLAGGD